jgi:hypothetical protein
MGKTALITGASNGIGLELAKLHAKNKGNLVLVARSYEKLCSIKTELEAQYSVKVWIIHQDLTETNAAMRVFEFTKQNQIEVDVLINNAGFGDHAAFHQQEITKIERMMQLNMQSLTLLTRLYLPRMIEKQKGQILNLASIAAFMPGPRMAVYYATKAYVKSFSLAIAEEVKQHQISVTVYCPGPVKSGFVEAGDLVGVKAWDKAPTAEQAAMVGYQAMTKKTLIAFNETKLRLLVNWIFPFFPMTLILKLSKQSMDKS